MKPIEINPFIRFYAEIPSPVSTSGFVKAYDSRIFFIEKGERVDFYIESEKFTLMKNDAVYLPSGTRYRYTYKKGSEVSIKVINFDFTSSASDRVNAMSPIRENLYDESLKISAPYNGEFASLLLIKEAMPIKKAFDKIGELFAKKDLFYKEFSGVELKRALLSIAVLNRKDDKKSPQKVQKLTEYISLNYSEDVTLEKAGEILGYHPYHVNRIMKKELGKTLHAYLLDERIRQAKILLDSTELSVVEIGASVGFENQSHFSYVFKSKEKVTPTEYRRERELLSQ